MKVIENLWALMEINIRKHLISKKGQQKIHFGEGVEQSSTENRAHRVPH